MEKMQKLNLRMQKLDFPGTHWPGLALIGAQKKPWHNNGSNLVSNNDQTTLFDRTRIVLTAQTLCSH